MIIPSEELLVKFGNAPGLCSAAEILEVHEWLEALVPHIDRYKSVFGDMTGQSHKSLLDKAVWYKDYIEKNLT